VGLNPAGNRIFPINNRHPMSESTPSERRPEPDPQAELMSEWKKQVQGCTFQMHRHLDQGEVDAAFQKAIEFVEPLITHKLTLRNYYELYHNIYTSLLELSVAISDPIRVSDRQVAEQSEVVQSHKAALPRLY
jgi:hypothetical protein